ncbi:DUF4198 domain-containing protein [uncultured Pseudodesulfovibrio sp.]|uniref:DUF4198 domain-containing protein n=1 Tax=uncultured Pseudodesulfovibrio sp. TaxID=2035858 RepID=UPI0029C7F1B7|nr:DUF4198 domain-containing protein [uncultured Pseudodesulfovibrio sp.]
MKNRILSCVVALCALLVAASAATAHEFIVKPVQLTAEKDAVIPFSVVSAHVFMISEEMEPIESVEVGLVQDGKKEAVKLTPNEPLMTLDGRITPTKEGMAIVAGHRKGVIWTQTTSGWKQASKKGLKGVISSGKYEKFCKTLLTVGKADDGWKTVLGHRLEIVPMTDPTQARTGDELTFKVLFDGKPATPENVTATYDGFSMTPNTWAYMSEPYGNGMAKVKISHPGTWMVRVQHVVDKPTADYDKHVLRAVLIFKVQ